MCVPSNLDVAEALELSVDELVAKGSPFTAFDVTQRARKNMEAVGIDEKFRHKDVRVYIHELLEEQIDDGLVTRGQSPVHPAFQYSPTGPVKKPYKQPAPAPASPPGSIASVVTPVVASVSTVKLGRDNRGRVCMLKHDVQKLGASRGDTLWAEKGKTGELKIGFKSNLVNPFASYAVDKDGNVRVSSAVLARAGIPKTQSQVTVENDGSVLKIS